MSALRAVKAVRSGVAQIGRRLGLAVLLALAASGAPAVADQINGARFALLIANGNYPGARWIGSASKDAHLLLDELQRNQFDSTLRENVGGTDMRSAIETFESKISPGAVALFYFTGFGIQIDRQSYLLPVDAEIHNESDVAAEGISIDALVKDIDRRGAQVKIVILDAARRNPYERQFRTSSDGLASLDAPQGTLTLFSAAPGRLRSEDTDDTSLFMGELTKEMRSPDITAEEVFTHARIGVSRASNGDQVPWVASSLIDEFSFGKAAVAAAPPPAPPPVRVEPAPVRVAAPPAPPAPPVQPVAPAPLPVPVAVPQRPPAAVPVQAAQPEAPKPTANPPVGAPTDHFKDCEDCPDMIVLPPGSFEMGGKATTFESPVHRVDVGRPFAMAATETTFTAWEKCIAGGGCNFRPSDLGWGAGDRPVINVSWSDTQQYVAWLSKQTGHTYRLPSEAEWEYGARGGTTTAFAWGPAAGSGMANCRDCKAGLGQQTAPVRSFPPNRFGIFDMAGNVAEWVQDCWNESYRGAPKDTSAWLKGDCGQRVLRGGSFDSNAAYIRPSARFRYDADVRYFANGFRVVRDLQ